MQTLTIETPRRTLCLFEEPNGDIQINGDPYLRASAQKRSEEKLVTIPKSERARIAHFLATGEAIQ